MPPPPNRKAAKERALDKHTGCTKEFKTIYVKEQDIESLQVSGSPSRGTHLTLPTNGSSNASKKPRTKDTVNNSKPVSRPDTRSKAQKRRATSPIKDSSNASKKLRTKDTHVNDSDTKSPPVSGSQLRERRATSPTKGSSNTSKKPRTKDTHVNKIKTVSVPVTRSQTNGSSNALDKPKTEETRPDPKFFARDFVSRANKDLVVGPDDSDGKDIGDQAETPEQMKAELYPHQKSALAWMQKMEKGHNRGGILGDDMGLGKSISTLALILTHSASNLEPGKNANKTTVIVAPPALIPQWIGEIRNKVKDKRQLRVFNAHTKMPTYKEMGQYDVVLTTYDKLGKQWKSLDKYRKKFVPSEQSPDSGKMMEIAPMVSPDSFFHRIILDEAHCIKDYTTKRAKAAYEVKATYRWCLTGTPMMNNITEFGSLVQFLQIHPYDKRDKFKMAFEDSHQKGKVMNMLQKFINDILLRRTKDMVFNGKPIVPLPSKSEMTDHAVFNKTEQKEYKRLELQSRQDYLDSKSKGKEKSTLMLNLLLRLRQRCCHTFLQGIESGDAASNRDSDEDSDEDGDGGGDGDSDSELTEKDLPRLYKAKTIRGRQKYKECLRKVFTYSAKVRKFEEIIDKIQKDHIGEKTVVFSDWTSFLDILEIALEKANIGFVRLDGKMKAGEKEKALDAFETVEHVKVMFVSIKAGNTGLNLMVANHVIIMNPHWSPFVEMQAVARTHRIGQEKPVHVHRILVEGTIETRIARLHEDKQKLLSSALEGGQVSRQMMESMWTNEKLDNDEFDFLFGLNDL